jgi:hypothetical protein
MILLENIKRDTNMTWEMFTNAAFKISVIMKDDVKTYVNTATKGIPHQLFSDGYAKVEGDNLQLLIKIEPQGDYISNPRFFILPYSIPRTEDGSIAGQGYNIMLEDSTDLDYNDLTIFIHACKSSI